MGASTVQSQSVATGMDNRWMNQPLRGLGGRVRELRRRAVGRDDTGTARR